MTENSPAKFLRTTFRRLIGSETVHLTVKIDVESLILPKEGNLKKNAAITIDILRGGKLTTSNVIQIQHEKNNIYDVTTHEIMSLQTTMVLKPSGVYKKKDGQLIVKLCRSYQKGLDNINTFEIIGIADMHLDALLLSHSPSTFEIRQPSSCDFQLNKDHKSVGVLRASISILKNPITTTHETAITRIPSVESHRESLVDEPHMRNTTSITDEKLQLEDSLIQKESKISKLELLIRAKDEKIDSLRQALTSTEKKLQYREVKYAEADQQLDEVRNELEVYKRQFDTLNMKIKPMDRNKSVDNLSIIQSHNNLKDSNNGITAYKSSTNTIDGRRSFTRTTTMTTCSPPESNQNSMYSVANTSTVCVELDIDDNALLEALKEESDSDEEEDKKRVTPRTEGIAGVYLHPVTDMMPCGSDGCLSSLIVSSNKGRKCGLSVESLERTSEIANTSTPTTATATATTTAITAAVGQDDVDSEAAVDENTEDLNIQVQTLLLELKSINIEKSDLQRCFQIQETNNQNLITQFQKELLLLQQNTDNKLNILSEENSNIKLQLVINEEERRRLNDLLTVFQLNVIQNKDLQISQITTELRDSSARYGTLQERHLKALKCLDESNQRITELEKYVNALETQFKVKELENSLASLTAQYNETCSCLQRQENKVSELSDACLDLHTKLEQMTDKYTNLDIKYKELRLQQEAYIQLQEDSVQVQRQLEEAQELISSYEYFLNTCRWELFTLNKSLEEQSTSAMDSVVPVPSQNTKQQQLGDKFNPQFEVKVEVQQPVQHLSSQISQQWQSLSNLLFHGRFFSSNITIDSIKLNCISDKSTSSNTSTLRTPTTATNISLSSSKFTPVACSNSWIINQLQQLFFHFSPVVISQHVSKKITTPTVGKPGTSATVASTTVHTNVPRAGSAISSPTSAVSQRFLSHTNFSFSSSSVLRIDSSCSTTDTASPLQLSRLRSIHRDTFVITNPSLNIKSQSVCDSSSRAAATSTATSTAAAASRNTGRISPMSVLKTHLNKHGSTRELEDRLAELRQQEKAWMRDRTDLQSSLQTAKERIEILKAKESAMSIQLREYRLKNESSDLRIQRLMNDLEISKNQLIDTNEILSRQTVALRESENESMALNIEIRQLQNKLKSSINTVKVDNILEMNIINHDSLDNNNKKNINTNTSSSSNTDERKDCCMIGSLTDDTNQFIHSTAITTSGGINIDKTKANICINEKLQYDLEASLQQQQSIAYQNELLTKELIETKSTVCILKEQNQFLADSLKASETNSRIHTQEKEALQVQEAELEKQLSSTPIQHTKSLSTASKEIESVDDQSINN